MKAFTFVFILVIFSMVSYSGKLCYENQCFGDNRTNEEVSDILNLAMEGSSLEGIEEVSLDAPFYRLTRIIDKIIDTFVYVVKEFFAMAFETGYQLPNASKEVIMFACFVIYVTFIPIIFYSLIFIVLVIIYLIKLVRKYLINNRNKNKITE